MTNVIRVIIKKAEFIVNTSLGESLKLILFIVRFVKVTVATFWRKVFIYFFLIIFSNFDTYFSRK